MNHLYPVPNIEPYSNRVGSTEAIHQNPNR